MATGNQRLVTGDAVNVAARLEQAAGAQEILLGDLTYRLVRDYVDVEEVEPLDLKGKSEPVPAYRLVNVRESGERPRRLDSPIVGRAEELASSRTSLATVVEERRSRLVTVVGRPGSGSRAWSRSSSRTLDAGARPARPLPRVRRGITFWPLAELSTMPPDIERDTTEDALRDLSAPSGEAGAGARVAAAIGSPPTSSPARSSPGARASCSRPAPTGPLVLLVEDVHWAERTFLDLVQHVGGTAANADLLVVCTARQDLVECRPDFSTATGETRVVLGGLAAAETAELAERLIGRAGLPERAAREWSRPRGQPPVRGADPRDAHRRGAGPLRGRRWRARRGSRPFIVPPRSTRCWRRGSTTSADERAVVEPASVIGQVFVGRGRALAPAP